MDYVPLRSLEIQQGCASHPSLFGYCIWLHFGCSTSVNKQVLQLTRSLHVSVGRTVRGLRDCCSSFNVRRLQGTRYLLASWYSPQSMGI